MSPFLCPDVKSYKAKPEEKLRALWQEAQTAPVFTICLLHFKYKKTQNTNQKNSIDFFNPTWSFFYFIFYFICSISTSLSISLPCYPSIIYLTLSIYLIWKETREAQMSLTPTFSVGKRVSCLLGKSYCTDLLTDLWTWDKQPSCILFSIALMKKKKMDPEKRERMTGPVRLVNSCFSIENEAKLLLPDKWLIDSFLLKFFQRQWSLLVVF